MKWKRQHPREAYPLVATYGPLTFTITKIDTNEDLRQAKIKINRMVGHSEYHIPPKYRYKIKMYVRDRWAWTRTEEQLSWAKREAEIYLGHVGSPNTLAEIVNAATPPKPSKHLRPKLRVVK